VLKLAWCLCYAVKRLSKDIAEGYVTGGLNVPSTPTAVSSLRRNEFSADVPVHTRYNLVATTMT
jgi:hypothetical protein